VRAVDSDLELLNRLRAGDEESFVTMVTHYQPSMLRFARTMLPSLALAEEAVQDTWLGVIRGIDRFEGRSTFKTWLFRILANRARSTGAREPAHTALDHGPTVDPTRFDPSGQWADPVAPWTDAVDARLDASRWSAVLKAALDTLPPRQRQVVLLRDVEGCAHDEVCAILNISRGNQRLLLHRGRTQLRTMLESNLGSR